MSILSYEIYRSQVRKLQILRTCVSKVFYAQYLL
uniref:Uncharacterized protein n=1 Tax=Anguilla anguilla TaxID=7936 RepID=A0A0E9XZ44_ANGAN